MRRFLYTLLALAIASGAPATEALEDFAADTGDDAAEISPSSPNRRGKPVGWPDWAGLPDVVVAPVPSFGAAVPHGVAGSVEVGHSDSGVTDVTGFQSLDTPWRDVIAARLLDAALAGCRSEGALKVRIDMPLAFERVATLCRKCRFNYWRTVTRNGRRIHEFYTDLYSAPDEDRMAMEVPAQCRSASG